MLDSNNVIIKYLIEQGYNPSTKYYSYINLWKEWFENSVPKFHKYVDQFGEKREIYKLGMAKRVCEDWSSILYTERDSIVCKNKDNQSYIDLKLKQLEFNDIVPQNIETAFWSGTVGTITRVKNAKVVNKKIIADDKTYYELVNVNASQIIPLVIEDGKIRDVAFVSETTIESDKAFYIEIHELTNKGYVVKNRYINEKGEEKKNPSVVEEYETGSNIPLFSLLSPKILNNIEDNNGLGISVYSNAIDQLKTCDITYNNFTKDFYLGGKKIFYNKKLVRYETITYVDTEGKEVTKEVAIYPDDLMKQQWQVVGDTDMAINDKPLVTEYNPDLRVDENEKGINFALNVLAFKCGLGKSYYKFEDGNVVIDHLHPKQLLDTMRHLCKGKVDYDHKLCAALNRETSDGRQMTKYSHLLQDAIAGIVEIKQESDVLSLFSEGETTALRGDVTGLDDFELIAFLIIKEERQ